MTQILPEMAQDGLKHKTFLSRVCKRTETLSSNLKNMTKPHGYLLCQLFLLLLHYFENISSKNSWIQLFKKVPDSVRKYLLMYLTLSMEVFL